YYYLDSFYKESNAANNPYANILSKFCYIKNNLYIIYQELNYNKIDLIKDNQDINLILKVCFPNINKTSIKYLLKNLTKNHRNKDKSNNSNNENEDIPKTLHFVTPSSYVKYDGKTFSEEKYTSLYALGTLMIQDSNYIGLSYYKGICQGFNIKMIKDFIEKLTCCNINTINELAVLSAKGSIYCKNANNLYIIYAPNSKEKIVEVPEYLLGEDKSKIISLKDINKRRQLIEI
ncbi:MAG: hypothetical protein LUC97_00830, partial [Clostridiales bacterium]|nr:hypothetical protein [Clostridiales bacterium]